MGICLTDPRTGEAGDPPGKPMVAGGVVGAKLTTRGVTGAVPKVKGVAPT